MAAAAANEDPNLLATDHKNKDFGMMMMMMDLKTHHDNDHFIRSLADEDRSNETFQAVFTVIVLVVMFSVLITDRVGTDGVMLTALTAFYMANIITIQEALAGFSSQGLLTVLVLFVVAEGVNKTGALNWYIARLLGHPKTLSGAQLRVMIPVAMLSGFINDTPLVTLSLPVRHPARRLRIDLSMDRCSYDVIRLPFRV
jgi:hypothetical protein